jgi:serine/threonine protein kinase
VAQLQAGEHIGGRYRLEQRLGAGGMGEVWLAELEGAGAFRRRVVLKLLAPHRRGDERLAAMLADEARVVGQLHHPGIVAAIDYLESEEHGPVFVLEFVDGASLRAVLYILRMEGKSMPEELAAFVGAQVARALHVAHTAPSPIVHRDVAPDNILLSREGLVSLGDFGVALASGNWEVTDPGTAPKGKREYMAPEQAQGLPIGPPADLYALGKVISEATVAGPRLKAVLARATAVDPAQRQSSGAELAAELLAACPPPPEPETALAQWLSQHAGAAMVPRGGRAPQRSAPPPAGRGTPPDTLFKSVPKPTRLWLKITAAAVAIGALTAVGLERRKLGFVAAALAGQPQGHEGELKITSQPPAAEVYVDGNLRGTTPLTIDLPAGRHTIRLGSIPLNRFRGAEVDLHEGVQHELAVDLRQ